MVKGVAHAPLPTMGGVHTRRKKKLGNTEELGMKMKKGNLVET
jgi:hypothetical protein